MNLKNFYLTVKGYSDFLYYSDEYPDMYYKVLKKYHKEQISLLRMQLIREQMRVYSKKTNETVLIIGMIFRGYDGELSFTVVGESSVANILLEDIV